MSIRRARKLMRRALETTFPGNRSEAMQHLDWMAQLDFDQIDDLTRTDEGMRKLRGPLPDVSAADRILPSMDEVVVATPGRLNRLELARMLGGGTRRKGV